MVQNFECHQLGRPPNLLFTQLDVQSKYIVLLARRLSQVHVYVYESDALFLNSTIRNCS